MINSKLAIILLGVMVFILIGSYIANSVTYSPLGPTLDSKEELIPKNVQENINYLFQLVKTKEQSFSFPRVDSLPSSGYAEGKTIYNNADHKVYTSTAVVNDTGDWVAHW
jgi:hypothetical protein